jgi:hypothetical protein
VDDGRAGDAAGSRRHCGVDCARRWCAKRGECGGGRRLGGGAQAELRLQERGAEEHGGAGKREWQKNRRASCRVVEGQRAPTPTKLNGGKQHTHTHERAQFHALPLLSLSARLQQRRQEQRRWWVCAQNCFDSCARKPSGSCAPRQPGASPSPPGRTSRHS